MRIPHLSPRREIDDRIGEWALPATLTMPAGTGSMASRRPRARIRPERPRRDDRRQQAIQGSGDRTRVARHRRPALRQAHDGARREGHGGLTDFTVKQEVIEDVLEAVKALRAQPRIDPARVFVLGHSLGGMLDPAHRDRRSDDRGLIVLAGAARPLEEAIEAQTRYLAVADGTISPEEQQRHRPGRGARCTACAH